MSRNNMAPMRICSSTFEREGAGVHLLRCMRCRDTYYVNAEAQKAHWKVHKKTCRAVSAGELEEITRMTLPETFVAIQQRLAPFAPDALVAPLLRQLRANLEKVDSDDEEFMVARAIEQLHWNARALVFTLEYRSDVLWGAPGMTELLLTEDVTTLLLSKPVKKRMARFPNGLPTLEYARHVLTGEEQADAFALLSSDDVSLSGGEGKPRMSTGGRSDPAHNFCCLYFNLILAAAMCGPPPESNFHDARGTLRKGPLADAAIKRALQLYFDPNVRESVGDAMGMAPCFACTVFDSCLVAARLAKKGDEPEDSIDRQLRAMFEGGMNPGLHVFLPPDLLQDPEGGCARHRLTSDGEFGPGMPKDGAVKAALAEIMDRGCFYAAEMLDRIIAINLENERELKKEKGFEKLKSEGYASKVSHVDRVFCSSSEAKLLSDDDMWSLGNNKPLAEAIALNPHSPPPPLLLRSLDQEQTLRRASLAVSAKKRNPKSPICSHII
jgi:hypothetical protein